MNAIELNLLIKKRRDVFFVPVSGTHVLEMNSDLGDFAGESSLKSVADIISYQSTLGLSTTVIKDQRPMAVFGVCPKWNGVYEAWTLLDYDARRYPKEMTSVGRQFMEIVTKYYNLHRLQIYVRCESERAVQWGMALGFTIEGKMCRYMPNGEDAFMMSRCKA